MTRLNFMCDVVFNGRYDFRNKREKNAPKITKRDAIFRSFHILHMQRMKRFMGSYNKTNQTN